MTQVYKILGAGEWTAACESGAFHGAGVDLADGYIHLSTADQAQRTADLYFKGRADLMLLRIDAAALGEALKWEPSRGGALFPHLYAPLVVDQVAEARPVALNGDGAPDLGPLAP